MDEDELTTVTIHFMDKETGLTIKNCYSQTSLPVVGDRITLRVVGSQYHYLVSSRRFVYEECDLVFVEVVLEKV